MRDYRQQTAGLRGAAKGLREIDMPKTAEQMEEAANAIEELLQKTQQLEDQLRDATKMIPEWHPVSDPPKENGRYYVAYEDAVSFLDFFNGKWFFPPRNGIVVEEMKESILYWQPLPEPPEEVE